jgi:LacI family transcriptional regulator
MKRRTTLADLANELKLSKTLISLVLNGKGDDHNISKTTQKKVLELAENRNYKPLQSARSLRTGKSGIIGLIVPSISNSFYAAIAEGIERQLSKAQLRLFVSNSNENQLKEKDQVQLLLQHNIDGLIVASTLDNPEYYEKLAKTGLPVVFFDRCFEKCKLPCVEVNNYDATNEALQKLLKKGYKNILFMSPGPSHLNSLNLRKKAYTDLQKEGKVGNLEPIEVDTSNAALEIKRSLDNYIKNTKSKKAVFTANNELAFEVISYCKKEKLAIPSDLAIWSFDDLLMFGIYSPTISGIDQPVFEIGERAADLMIESLEEPNGKTGRKITLIAEVKERESV